MPDMLNIGTSALVAFQRALTTTSHNISNASTDGYSRQTVELSTRIPEPSGAGFFGTGVDVTSVKRQYDQFLTQQVNYQSSASNRLDAYYTSASQVDNLLADPQAGLTPTLQDFFNSVQTLANDPTSDAARQNLLTSGQTLASRFHAINQRLSDAQSRVNEQMTTSVSEINQMADSIAELNKEIVSLQNAAGGQPPNDLLDKRDQVLKELSQRVSISTVQQDDGMVNVFVGTGQGIVVGPSVTHLAVAPDPALPTRQQITIGSANGPNVTSLLTGGTLGGIVDFQNQILDPAQRQLGQVAAAVAFTFNDQHHLGLDLNQATGGDIGGDFFNPAAYTAIPGFPYKSNNPASAVTMDITSASALGSGDFVIKFDKGNATQFSVYNTNGSVAKDATGAAIAGTIGINIPQLGFTVKGAAAAGDQFYMRPTGTAASNIDVAITDPNKVAAATPIAANVAVSNMGNVTVGALSVSRDAAQTFANYEALGGPAQTAYDQLVKLSAGNIKLTYNGAGAFTVAGPYTVAYLGTPPPAVPGTIPYNPLTDDGKSVKLQVSDGAGNTIDISFTLGGTPLNGDVVNIGTNVNGQGDNGNALALGKLQSASTMQGGTASYQTVYAGLVADVGTKTHSADMNKQVADTLYQQAVSAREAVSGVNLDEEAANLLKYQQAYMASTKMVTVANTLFQTLLSAVGA